MNDRLMQQLLPDLDHEHRFSDDDVRRMDERGERLDPGPLHAFVRRCSAAGPWLWKDPRLTWTIRLWSRALDVRTTSFLVLTREPVQAWITANQRRHVQSMRFTRAYNDGITRSNEAFLAERNLRYQKLSFEELLLEPELSLARLNEHFGLRLSLDDLRRVCRIPLGRRSRSVKDFCVAALVYAKNYAERDGRAPLRPQQASPVGS